MNIIAFIIIGLVAGWIASLIVQNKGFSFVGDLFIGLIGAIAGGLIYEISSVTLGYVWGSLTMSVLGAILFIFLVRLFSTANPVRRY